MDKRKYVAAFKADWEGELKNLKARQIGKTAFEWVREAGEADVADTLKALKHADETVWQRWAQWHRNWVREEVARYLVERPWPRPEDGPGWEAQARKAKKVQRRIALAKRVVDSLQQVSTDPPTLEELHKKLYPPGSYKAKSALARMVSQLHRYGVVGTVVRALDESTGLVALRELWSDDYADLCVEER